MHRALNIYKLSYISQVRNRIIGLLWKFGRLNSLLKQVECTWISKPKWVLVEFKLSQWYDAKQINTYTYMDLYCLLWGIQWCHAISTFGYSHIWMYTVLKDSFQNGCIIQQRFLWKVLISKFKQNHLFEKKRWFVEWRYLHT